VSSSPQQHINQYVTAPAKACTSISCKPDQSPNMESTLSQSLSFHPATTPTILIDPQSSRSSSPDQPPQTIKMEEIERSSSTTSFLDIPGTSTLDISASLPIMATSTTTVDQKPPPKKRKSWGQVLPEPKTSLPPRKRAKTADEKEQRRIERVKRNRLAAHNSRERKRQEGMAMSMSLSLLDLTVAQWTCYKHARSSWKHSLL
jgi:hypothetical protein